MIAWGDLLGLVMEYAAGGSLFHTVARTQGLSEDNARWYFQQIVIANDFCRRLVRPLLIVRFLQRMQQQVHVSEEAAPTLWI